MNQATFFNFDRTTSGRTRRRLFHSAAAGGSSFIKQRRRRSALAYRPLVAREQSGIATGSGVPAASIVGIEAPNGSAGPASSRYAARSTCHFGLTSGPHADSTPAWQIRSEPSAATTTPDMPNRCASAAIDFGRLCSWSVTAPCGPGTPAFERLATSPPKRGQADWATLSGFIRDTS